MSGEKREALIKRQKCVRVRVRVILCVRSTINLRDAQFMLLNMVVRKLWSVTRTRTHFYVLMNGAEESNFLAKTPGGQAMPKSDNFLLLFGLYAGLPSERPFAATMVTYCAGPTYMSLCD